jgi:hypothetical protein
MITALTHLQHVRDKHVIYVAILEEKTDDFNRRYYQLQLEGSKTALELPGVLDEVVTLAMLKADDGTTYRGFVTGADNTLATRARTAAAAWTLSRNPISASSSPSA